MKYLSIVFYGLLAVCFFSGSVFSDTVRMNEVMASNGSTITDQHGDFSDWIELYNYGAESVDLSGWGLSDKLAEPLKWQFPSELSLGAGATLIIWASGKDLLTPELHANFSISAAGESLVLCLPDGTVVDALDATEIPRDVSLGRTEAGGVEWFFFAEPTPQAANVTEAFSRFLEPPLFSHSAGFYDEPFELSITASEGVTILYTLDGSEPSVSNLDGRTYSYKTEYPKDTGVTELLGPLLAEMIQTLSYSAPVPIIDRTASASKLAQFNTRFTSQAVTPAETPRKGTVVRSKVVQEGHLPSRTVTHTYFVGSDFSELDDLLILSIAVDEPDLFSYDEGIYVPGVDADDWRLANAQSSWNPGRPANYTQRGEAAERGAHLEVFTADGERGLSQDLGVRIHGGWSRANKVKSLRLYARAGYGDDSFDYPFFPELEKRAFPGEPLERFERLILRNSGGFNDWEFTYFRDAFAQSLVNPLSFDNQAYRPAVHFINGEYWGLINIRERQDEGYFLGHYGVNEDEIAILETSLTEGLVVDTGTPSDLDHFLETVAFAQTNEMAVPDNYIWVQERVDTDNLAAYYAMQIYFNNKDWPDNNNDLWRKRTLGYQPDSARGHDGRWRWLLYDTDFGFGGWNFPRTGRPLARVLNVEGYRASGIQNSPVNQLFRALVFNSPDFRNTFINAMADQLNSVFRENRVVEILDSFEAHIAPFRAEHNNRWQTNLREDLKMRTHALNWPDWQRTQIADEFALSGCADVTLHADPTMGRVRINSLWVDSELSGIPDVSMPYPWSGTYFVGVPVDLEAIAVDGYRFVGWRASGTDDFLEVESTMLFAVDGDAAVEAIFEEVPRIEQRIPLHRWDFEGASVLWTPTYTVGGGGITIEGGDPDIEVKTSTGKGFATEHLRINNPLGSVVDLSLPTDGFEQIRFDFLTRRSGSGAGAQYVSYTVDGIEWTELEDFSVLDAPPQLLSLNLSEIPAVANNFNFGLRFSFVQEDGGIGGNNRFDEICVSGVRLITDDTSAYEQWVSTHFSEFDAGRPELSDPSATPLNDGIPNLIKYALGLVPADPVTEVHLEQGVNETDELFIRFYLDHRKVDVTYAVEASRDLSEWNDVLFDSSEEIFAAGDEVEIHEVNIRVNEAPIRFIRLRVTQLE
jgi:hypothetical protein